jgi:hypothetical protein
MITRPSLPSQGTRSNSRSRSGFPISSNPRRVLVVALAALLFAACRPDMPAWHQQLARPEVARLAGIWSVELSVMNGAGIPAHSIRDAGTLALVLNRERVTTSLFGPPPVAFGTYDIPFDSMGVNNGDPLGTPDVWANVVGDSVTLVLSPKAKWPISLAGTWHGDSLVGRWNTDQRAGLNGLGDFVLRRR